MVFPKVTIALKLSIDGDMVISCPLMYDHTYVSVFGVGSMEKLPELPLQTDRGPSMVVAGAGFPFTVKINVSDFDGQSPFRLFPVNTRITLPAMLSLIPGV